MRLVFTSSQDNSLEPCSDCEVQRAGLPNGRKEGIQLYLPIAAAAATAATAAAAAETAAAAAGESAAAAGNERISTGGGSYTWAEYATTALKTPFFPLLMHPNIPCSDIGVLQHPRYYMRLLIRGAPTTDCERTLQAKPSPAFQNHPGLSTTR